MKSEREAEQHSLLIRRDISDSKEMIRNLDGLVSVNWLQCLTVEIEVCSPEEMILKATILCLINTFLPERNYWYY